MAVVLGHELASSGLNEKNLHLRSLRELNKIALRFYKVLMYIGLEQPIVTAAANTFT